MATKVGEFSVDFELYRIGDTLKALQKYDREVDEAARRTEQAEKKASKATKSWADGWELVKLAAKTAITTMYAKMVTYSPAIQAHLTAIGVELQILGMTMGDAIEPVFYLLEDLVYLFTDWFYSLSDGEQKVVAYAAALGLVAMWLGKFGPLTTAAGLAVAVLAIAYAENFGNMRENVKELWDAIKEKDWGRAWDALIKTIKDLWTTARPYWDDFKNKIFNHFEVTNWGELGMKIVNKIRDTWANLWDTYLKPKWEDLKTKMSTWADNDVWSDLGVKIGKSIASGIWSKVKDIFGSVFEWAMEKLNLDYGDLGMRNTGNGGYRMTQAEYDRAMGEQAGGLIPSTGLYMMHAGEQVIPSASAGGISGGTIIVTNNNVFYGNTLGDPQTMQRNVNEMSQQLKNDIKQWQSTGVGGRF